MAKDQQISELTQKLEAQCQRKTSIASQDLETIQRKSKAKVNIKNSADKWIIIPLCCQCALQYAIQKSLICGNNFSSHTYTELSNKGLPSGQNNN